MQITNQTVLITGGTRGIGLALARRFQQSGNRVIITGRSKINLPHIETVIADMTHADDLKRLHENYPDVTILINNAGVQYNTPLAQVDLASVDNEIHTNFLGLAQLTTLYLPNLLAQPEAAIVNISSGLAYVPKQSAPIYSGTKAAVHIFTKSLRWQLEDTSVRVFEVVPPLVETDMTQDRTTGKITTDQFVDAFWTDFQRNRYEIVIGKSKMLLRLNRWMPSVAERIMRR